jgi:hypothetical protein
VRSMNATEHQNGREEEHAIDRLVQQSLSANRADPGKPKA